MRIANEVRARPNTPRSKNRPAGRDGLSLIEVIIALGILVGTTAVLVQLIRIGERQANRALDMTDAQTICHNKLAEFLAGLGPLTPVQNEPASTDSLWNYSLQVQPVGLQELYAVSVSVTKPATNNAANVQEAQPQRPVYHLTRWVAARELPLGFQNESMEVTDTEVGSANPISSGSLRGREMGPRN